MVQALAPELALHGRVSCGALPSCAMGGAGRRGRRRCWHEHLHRADGRAVRTTWGRRRIRGAYAPPTRSTSSSPAAPPVSQGRHADPPQHRQQRFLRRRGMRLTERRPAVHSRAAVPLLRHGAGQPGLPDARRLHRLPNDGFEPADHAGTVRPTRCTAPARRADHVHRRAGDHPRVREFDLSSLRTGIMAGRPARSR